MNQIQLKNGERSIRFEFRLERIALVFSNFNGEKLATLAEMMYTGCRSVEEVRQVTNYDENVGAIILVLKRGYVPKESEDEIAEVFACFCELYPD